MFQGSELISNCLSKYFGHMVKRTNVEFVFAGSGVQIYIFVYEAKSTY